MKATKTMLLVIDDADRIIAAAHPESMTSSDVLIEIVPLPGQEVHLVEVPAEIARLESAHAFHMVVERTKFDRATKKFVFPELLMKESSAPEGGGGGRGRESRG